jgi:hypothetical protein
MAINTLFEVFIIDLGHFGGVSRQVQVQLGLIFLLTQVQVQLGLFGGKAAEVRVS